MDDTTQMTDEEFYEHKKRLRIKALLAETTRLKKEEQSDRRIISLLIAVLVISLIVLFGFIWSLHKKNVELKKMAATVAECREINTKVSTIDTVFVEKERDTSSACYTVQVGAYESYRIPDFLKERSVDFPFFQYKYNKLNCFAFGCFQTIKDAEKACFFLQTIGIETPFVTFIRNNQRVAHVDTDRKVIWD